MIYDNTFPSGLNFGLPNWDLFPPIDALVGYRATDDAEWFDMLGSRQMRMHPCGFSAEGKYLARTADDAHYFARGKAHYLGVCPRDNYQIVQVVVPLWIPSLYVFDKLDGVGPAIFIHRNDLWTCGFQFYAGASGVR